MTLYMYLYLICGYYKVKHSIKPGTTVCSWQQCEILIVHNSTIISFDLFQVYFCGGLVAGMTTFFNGTNENMSFQ